MLVPDHRQVHRGRHALRPGRIPWAGWKDIAYRVVREVLRDNLYLVAAGVAFYWVLALFPALAVVVSAYGLVSDPLQVQQQLVAMSQVLPGATVKVIGDELHTLATAPATALSLGAIISTLISLVTAMWGTMALMTALNIVYDERETRSFFRLYGLALLLTAGALLFSVFALLLVAAAPAYLQVAGNTASGLVEFMINIGRWPMLATVMIVALAALYRYGPSRRHAKWRWISTGAVLGTLLWLLASAVFSLYVSEFQTYNKTYGSLAAFVVLLMWFYITAYVILLSAEIDAEIEHQTTIDSTVGPDRPMGERGAYVADTVGKTAVKAPPEQAQQDSD